MKQQNIASCNTRSDANGIAPLSSFISHHSSLQRKQRFTLIELLVVIAVIAILAGMLIPSLSKAKTTAQGIECTSRKKQVAMVMISYGNTFDGWMIGSSTPYESKSWNGGTKVYYSLLKDFGFVQMANTGDKQCILSCPILKGINGQWGACNTGVNQATGLGRAYKNNTKTFAYTRAYNGSINFFKPDKIPANGLAGIAYLFDAESYSCMAIFAHNLTFTTGFIDGHAGSYPISVCNGTYVPANSESAGTLARPANSFMQIAYGWYTEHHPFKYYYRMDETSI